ncbi:MAG TPA: hypothetical protein VGB79_10300 [Allosphingosinicella sp.]|jgi:hypothetical protein
MSSKDDQRSFEEKEVLSEPAASSATRASQLLPLEPRTAASSDRMPPRPWPAALTWQDALAYTSLSDVELRRGVRRGIVKLKCVGRRGCRVAGRDQLDRLVALVFGPEPVGIEEDFDFG